MIIQVEEVHTVRYSVDDALTEQEALQLVRDGKVEPFDETYREQSRDYTVKVIRLNKEAWWQYVLDRITGAWYWRKA